MALIKPEDLKTILERIVAYSPKHIVNFIAPEELEKYLQDQFQTSPHSLENLTELVQVVLERCLNTHHEHFVNQLYGGVNPFGQIAAFIVEKMNTNQHTYEVAPVFLLTERIALRQLRLLFYGTEEGDGIFAPGGSLANMYGLITARQDRFPESKHTGLSGLPPLVIFVSEDAHYSGAKVANWMGLGLDNVVKIRTNKQGAIIPSELQDAIKKCKNEGKVPLAVLATSGTTVLGAFDPLDEISEICKPENIWLHCDAAWGGAFIFSDKLKAKYLKGIEKCDSICYNAHKMLCAPTQCSAFITKKPNILSATNSVPAPYLFQDDKHYDASYDQSGSKSIQCGRKSDAFKFWLMWIAMGKDGIKAAIENTEDCARYFAETIKSKEGFMLYLDAHQCTNVFFWYIPKRMRTQERTGDWWNEIGQITSKIRTKLFMDQTVMIGYAPLPNKNVPNAFRLVLTSHPPKTYKGMDFIIECLGKIGEEF